MVLRCLGKTQTATSQYAAASQTSGSGCSVDARVKLKLVRVAADSVEQQAAMHKNGQNCRLLRYTVQ
jgi:hypothetical protein